MDYVWVANDGDGMVYGDTFFKKLVLFPFIYTDLPWQMCVDMGMGGIEVGENPIF